jgi:hypothetical protein
MASSCCTSASRSRSGPALPLLAGARLTSLAHSRSRWRRPASPHSRYSATAPMARGTGPPGLEGPRTRDPHQGAERRRRTSPSRARPPLEGGPTARAYARTTAPACTTRSGASRSLIASSTSPTESGSPRKCGGTSSHDTRDGWPADGGPAPRGARRPDRSRSTVTRPTGRARDRRGTSGHAAVRFALSLRDLAT